MKTLNTLATEIQTALATFDAKWKEGQVAWFAERKQALNDWQNSEEGKQFKKEFGIFPYYKKMWEISGGKTYFSMYANDFEKHCDRTIKSRNERIAYKIIKSGDENTSVDSGNIIYTNDGFHGLFGLNTSTGQKSINIKTIMAGGYNIQCFHLRTLIKVK